MNTERVNRILASMKEKNVPQLIVTDPMMLFYVLGKEFSSGERMQALLLRADGEHVFFLNDLYPEDQTLGVKMVQYNDVDDAVALLCKYLVKGEAIAVDKNWAARFVLHLQELCNVRLGELPLFPFLTDPVIVLHSANLLVFKRERVISWDDPEDFPNC